MSNILLEFAKENMLLKHDIKIKNRAIREGIRQLKQYGADPEDYEELTEALK